MKRRPFLMEHLERRSSPASWCVSNNGRSNLDECGSRQSDIRWLLLLLLYFNCNNGFQTWWWQIMNIIIAFWRARGCWCCMTISPHRTLFLLWKDDERRALTRLSLISRILVATSHLLDDAWVKSWTSRELSEWWETARASGGVIRVSHDHVVGRLWFHILLLLEETSVLPPGDSNQTSW
jgi:hypothetical protein